MKKDYRWGMAPLERRQNSENLIMEALKEGKKRFKSLLEITGLSRPALASNLKRLCQNGYLKREVDPEDYRVTYYSLTEEGWNRLKQQEEIVFLGSSELNLKADNFADIQMEGFKMIAENVAEALNQVFKEGMICTIERIMDIPPDCVSFSIYSRKRRKASVKGARRLAEVAKSAMLVAIGTLNKRELKGIPEVSIVFRFNKDKVDKYLTTVHAVAKKQKVRFPDIRDYLNGEH